MENIKMEHSFWDKFPTFSDAQSLTIAICDYPKSWQ
jgi:hypothetical protein